MIDTVTVEPLNDNLFDDTSRAQVEQAAITACSVLPTAAHRFHKVGATAAARFISDPLIALNMKSISNITVKQLLDSTHHPFTVFVVVNQNDVELAWLFHFSPGVLSVTRHSIVWRDPTFDPSLLKRHVVMKNGRPMLVPDVLLSNSEFSVLATPDKKMIMCGTPNTSVVTQ